MNYVIKFIENIFNNTARTENGEYKALCPNVFTSIKENVCVYGYDSRYKLHLLSYTSSSCIVTYKCVKMYIYYNWNLKKWVAEQY